MTNKSILLITIFIAINQSLLAMDPKEESTPAKPAREDPGLAPQIEDEHKGTGHKDRSSIIINIGVDGVKPEQQPSDTGKKPHHKHKASSVTDIASVTIQPAGSPSTAQPGSSLAKGNSVTFEINMQDIANATPEEIDKLVDSLIRQASIAVFASHDENAFYVPDLKAALLQSLSEYIKTSHGAKNPDSSSSSDSSLDEPHSISSHRGTSLIEPKQAVVARLRQGVFERLSSKKLILPSTREHPHVAAAAATGTGVETEATAHKELKEWFLRELELHDLKMREQERELKEKAAEDKEKLADARRKTKYAIAATVVSTVCGLATILVTYFTAHTTQGSN